MNDISENIRKYTKSILYSNKKHTVLFCVKKLPVHRELTNIKDPKRTYNSLAFMFVLIYYKYN